MRRLLFILGGIAIICIAGMVAIHALMQSDENKRRTEKAREVKATNAKAKANESPEPIDTTNPENFDLKTND